MGDFIFPECPGCGEKASEGTGVRLYELPWFTYKCPNCYHKTRGYFGTELIRPVWETPKKMSKAEMVVFKLRTWFA